MPIFRVIDSDAENNIFGEDPRQEKVVPGRASSSMSLGSEEHKHLRSAAPADRPLPRTLKWATGLPPHVQPTALLRHYGRIANVIAATWNHPTSLRSYLDCLFSDNRGNRQGFPPEILGELLALKRYRDTLESAKSSD